MEAKCEECGKPVQKPYKVVCSAECKAERQKAASRRYEQSNREKRNERMRCQRKANPNREKENERQRLWRKANPEKNREFGRRCYKANPEKAKARARCWKNANRERKNELNRRWAKNNSEYYRRWERTKMETDIRFKLGVRLRKRLCMAIRRNYKSGSAVADLGCTIDELKLHLERQFDANMTWGNYGEFWEIDHILPLASFDLTDREQLLQAVHWSNLQPLTVEDNLKKGARIVAQVEELALAA